MEMDLYHVGFNPTRFVWGCLTTPLYIVEAPIPHWDLIDNCDDNCYSNLSNNLQDWLGWVATLVPLSNDFLSSIIIQVHHIHVCKPLKFIITSFKELLFILRNYLSFILNSSIVRSSCYRKGMRGGDWLKFITSTTFHTCHHWLGWSISGRIEG